MGNIYRQLNMRMLNPFEFARMAWPQAARSVAPSTRAARAPIPRKPYARVEDVFRAARVVTIPSLSETYYLGDGRGFAGLGDVADGGVTFTNHDAHSDFISGVQLRGSAGRWDGVSAFVVNQLEVAITDALGPQAQIKVEEYRAKAQPVARRIDELQRFGFGGRSEGQDSSYKAAMQQLKNLMLTYTINIRAAVAQDRADEVARPPPLPKQEFKKQEFQQRRDGGGGVTDDVGLPSWLLPVGLGVAAVGVGYFVFKRGR